MTLFGDYSLAFTLLKRRQHSILVCSILGVEREPTKLKTSDLIVRTSALSLTWLRVFRKSFQTASRTASKLYYRTCIVHTITPKPQLLPVASQNLTSPKNKIPSSSHFIIHPHGLSTSPQARYHNTSSGRSHSSPRAHAAAPSTPPRHLLTPSQ